MHKNLQYGMDSAAWVCEIAEGIFIPTSGKKKENKS